VEIQKGSEDKDMRRGMITSIDTVTQVSIKFRQMKENKNMARNIEHNTKHTYEYDNKCVRTWRRNDMRMDD
jgi:hypothetical protein